MEAEECLRPLAEVLEVKAWVVDSHLCGEGNTGVQEGLQQHVGVHFDGGGDVKTAPAVPLLLSDARPEDIDCGVPATGATLFAKGTNSMGEGPQTRGGERMP